MSTTAKSSDKSQLDRFKETARELETDDSEEAFDLVLKRVAKPKPETKEPPKKRSEA